MSLRQVRLSHNMTLIECRTSPSLCAFLRLSTPFYTFLHLSTQGTLWTCSTYELITYSSYNRKRATWENRSKVHCAYYIILILLFIVSKTVYSNKSLTNFNLKVDVLSKFKSVKFSLIESVIYPFTDSSVKKYFSLLNQLIFTDSSVKKIFFTVKSVNFHWNNQWNLTDLQ